VLLDGPAGRLHCWKVPGGGDAAGKAAAGLAELMARAGLPPGAIGRVVHGTTLATNLIVEGKGARVGLITTAGFRDIIEIGRMKRARLYDIFVENVPPLAPRPLRIEVRERMDAGGRALEAPREAEVVAAGECLVARGAEALAVGFLNSYVDPAHERATGEWLARALPGVPVSLSSEVAPEYGEYERFSSVVVNAALLPHVGEYLGGLQKALDRVGVRPPVELMQSNGGIVPCALGLRAPARLVSSGPAAGVIGGAWIASRSGYRDIITFDMGGTTTDVCLIPRGRPLYTSEVELAGHPLRAVRLDVRSVGAGGGSLASLDRTGALRVGPESAGGEPGPASYGLGGDRPTVTDADLVLGYLNPDRFCGGARRLDAALAAQAIRRHVAEPARVGVIDAALGIVTVCATNMVGAVRKVTTERGYDPRDFTLVAFGGAGPVHAGQVAAELHIPRVLVPPAPGLVSAQGLLLADQRTDCALTYPVRLDAVEPGRLTAAFRRLEAEGRARLRDGPAGPLAIERIAECCYVGQRNALPIRLPARALARADLGRLARQVDAAFARLYGFLPPHRMAQIVTLRVFVRRAAAPAPFPLGYSGAQSAVASPPARPVVFPGRRVARCPVLDRAGLAAGRRIAGPAIIEDDYATAVIWPGQRGQVDRYGNLVIELPGRRDE
jgi:N-methylhydantoinase A